MAPSHIPAWQRLGLKLRNQPSSTANVPPQFEDAGATPKKRKFTEDDPTAGDLTASFPAPQPSSKPKKKKTAASAQTTPSSVATKLNGTFLSEPLANDPTKATVEASTERRRKSVTFSPDTKTEDGASSKRLVQAAMARRAGIDDEQVQAATLKLEALPASALHVDAEARKSDKGKKKKKQKKGDNPKQGNDKGQQGPKVKSEPTSKASTSKGLAENTTTRQSAALRYLDEYASDRSAWKFSKARQTVLLKGLFDLDKTPASYDDALSEYLAGLQGANIRRKLRAEALEILSAEDTKIIDDDIKASEAKRQRAQLVFDAIPKAESPEEAEATPVKTEPDIKVKMEPGTTADAHVANGISKANAVAPTPQKRRRRRNKKRRVASSDDESSSSSESSDESDASEMPSKKSTANTRGMSADAIKKGKKPPAPVVDSDETSSSGDESEVQSKKMVNGTKGVRSNAGKAAVEDSDATSSSGSDSESE